MKKIIIFPLIHLILEYLDISKCICDDNYLDNNVYNLSLTCKELNKYIKDNKLIIKKKYIKIPNSLDNYFNIKYICEDHLEISIKKYKEICNNIHELHNVCNVSVDDNISLFEKELKFIKKDNEKFIHDINYKNALSLKNFIKRRCINICISQESCCDGKGFGIKLPIV